MTINGIQATTMPKTMQITPSKVMVGLKPFTYPNAIKFAVEIAKNMNPYKFEPVLCPNTICEKDGAVPKIPPIQIFANKTSIK